MLSRTLPRLFKGRLLAFLLVVAAFVPAAPASAATARFFGQVFQVDPAQAEDSNISAGDLSGSPLAFVRIQLYNRADGALLATGDAGINGQFTLRFTPPTGPAPNVEARVFRVVDGGSTLLPAARAGINFFDHLGLFTPAALKVAGEDRSTVGESGLSSIPGIGLLFTRVGKVEIPFIAQNTALASRPVAGLADLNADPVRAAELGISFEKAPFAGLLQVFGDFGTPSASCNCPPGPPCVPSIDYYRATLRKINEAAPGLVYDSEMPFLDPLHKIRTQVTTLPTLSLVNSTVSIGPLDGGLDDPATPALEEAPISGLYWVNRNEVGGVTSTFYSYPDLRLAWNSHLANGLYEIRASYYHRSGTTPSGAPRVQELPASCFAGPLPAGTPGALDKLVLRVDNHPLEAHFDHVYMKNPTTSGYYRGGGQPDTSDSSLAFDFNGEGLCDILHLASLYQVEVRFTARQEGGYLQGYSLDARSNSGAVVVPFASESFGAHTTATNPLWPGTPPGGETRVGGGFSIPCAYLFRLSVSSRLQDGYTFLQHASPVLAFYVTP